MSATTLVFSHSLELLFQRFSQHYSESIEDPLHPPELIFASPISKQWLTQELTTQFDVVAALQGRYIESYLWHYLSDGYVHTLAEEELPVKLLKVDVLQHHLLDLLNRPALEELEAQTLIDYLEEEGQFNEVKRVQLAMKLAQLFLEYELNRPPVIGAEVPGLADTWLAGQSYLRDFGGREISEDVLIEERWQMNIYQRLFNHEGLLAPRAGIQYLTLPQIWHLRLSDSQGHLKPRSQCMDILRDLFGTSPVFLFAISTPAHFHRNLLADISAFKPIHAYLHNPCGAFWEDLERYQTMGAAQGEQLSLTEQIREYLSLHPMDYAAESMAVIDQFKFRQSEGDNRLLQLWANAGRENITLWSQFADYDFEYLEGEPEQQAESTQLELLKTSIIERQALEASSGSSTLESDHSVVLLKSPSQVREIETIRDLIYEMMSGSDTWGLDQLKPHEIGIYIPDLAAYQGAIEQVFGSTHSRREGYLPYTVLSVNASQSWYSRAIQSLLKLVQGEFNRLNLTQFLRNPFVQEALGVDASAIQQWESWIHELNAYRGYHAEDLVRYGDCEATPLKTWKLAVDRMIAAWIVDGSYQELEPWMDLSYASETTKVQFCQTIQSLYAALETFRSLASAEEFQQHFIEFLNHWVSIPQEYRSEETIRNQLMIRLSQFSQESRVSTVSEFCAWLDANLEGEIPGRNDAKAGHIVFGSISHAQILPYRVVFVAGLNGGSFPGQMNPSAIDLLSSVRILGDHHSVDSNKLAFLELLLQAQERLIFSYQSRNIQKDEELQPSSVLLEMQSYFQERSFELKTYEIPLLSRDLKLVQPWLEHSDGESFSDSLNEVPWRTWGVRDLSFWENQAPTLDEMDFKKSHPEVMNKAYFKNFLESPLDWHLQKQLSMYDDDQLDVAAANESAYVLSPLDKSIVLQSMIQQFVESHLELISAKQSSSLSPEEYIREHLQQSLDAQVARGYLPEGRFEHRQLRQIHEELRVLFEFIQQEFSPELCSLESLEWPSLVSLDDSYHLSFTQPILLRKAGQLQIIKINTSKYPEYGHHLLDVWIQAMYLKLSHDEDVQVLHVGLDKSTTGEFIPGCVSQLVSCDASRAREWFLGVLQEMDQSHYQEHLPLGTLSKLLKFGTKDQSGQILNFDELSLRAEAWMDLLEDEDSMKSGYYAKTEMIDLMPWYVPEDCFHKVQTRLGEFYQGALS